MREALHRVLAEDVVSPVALPPWDNSAMDGYAVRAEDIRGASAAAPVSLPVTGTVAAGAAPTASLRPGHAIVIMTGAPLPAGADSVVRVEDTDGGKDRVIIRSDRDALRNVRSRGEDVGRGSVVVSRRTALQPAHLGLLASVGRDVVRAFRRPVVAILASGDELVDVDRFDDVRAGHKIVTSNSYTLEAAVRAAGGIPSPLGIVPDRPEELRARIAGCRCDLLLTSGGVSVGAHDHTRSVLAELGARLSFWKARIRPGAPISFGMLHETPWLGLPGNPVSALVTFELFGYPALRKMQGHAKCFRQPVRVELEEGVTIAAPLTHFLRGVVELRDGRYMARLTGPQGSGLLSSMGRANALLVVPPERAAIRAGETVDALLLNDAAHHAVACPL